MNRQDNRIAGIAVAAVGGLALASYLGRDERAQVGRSGVAWWSPSRGRIGKVTRKSVPHLVPVTCNPAQIVEASARQRPDPAWGRALVLSLPNTRPGPVEQVRKLAGHAGLMGFDTVAVVHDGDEPEHWTAIVVEDGRAVRAWRMDKRFSRGELLAARRAGMTPELFVCGVLEAVSRTKGKHT